MDKQTIRCAIYTRKSSEEGLEQSFNSLDAQRESCVSYIESQKHQGWVTVKQLYDDGGFSGGTMERPALTQLLDDISTAKVDTVVVYKVDRLTRSLADFAKIIEIFDSNKVSFVSVTQQFNTTNSMGRLTLNVLLSFAQFERELTGERIRDKIAASKKKGMWMGGVVPLGYRCVDRHLVIRPKEAETVREIFRQYLRLGCVYKLQLHLRERHTLSRVRRSVNGKTSGGVNFSRGALYHLLGNRIYIGEIVHRQSSHPGQHEPIISRVQWDLVAARLKGNGQTRKRGNPAATRSLLTGIIFDLNGVRFTPTHSLKKGKRYRYYTSQAAIKRDKKGSVGARIPAQDLEDAVVSEIHGLLKDLEPHLRGKNLRSTKDVLSERATELADHWVGAEVSEKSRFVQRIIRRVVIGQSELWIDVSVNALLKSLLENESTSHKADWQECDGTIQLSTQIRLRRLSGETNLATPKDSDFLIASVPSVVKALARARDWYEHIVSGRVGTIKQLSKQCGLDPAYIKRTFPLALLSPTVSQSLVEGRHSATFSLQQLIRTFSPIWGEQSLLQTNEAKEQRP
jgi:DNA invertase Pin-like site-specific DNA recombinase